LAFSNVCIPAINIQGLGLDWLSAVESSSGITGGSGSNQNLGKVRSSGSRSPSEEPTITSHRILIIEDNPADVLLIRHAITTADLDVNIEVVRDGEEAIQFFDETERDLALKCPALVILDINLPRKQGSEVLQHMRASGRCGKALVITVSTSDSERDRNEMTRLGANGYFRKPSDYAEFMKLGDMIKDLFRRSRKGE
jgi:chemotaxis family two-component system response regulator Rcp1